MSHSTTTAANFEVSGISEIEDRAEILLDYCESKSGTEGSYEIAESASIKTSD